MPILGTIASSKLTASVPTNYESIATVIVGATAVSTISFTSIPSTYKHLQVRAIGRTNSNEDRAALSLMINSDNGNNYVTHGLATGGSSADGFNFTGQAGSGNQIGGSSTFTASLAAANTFGMSIIDILDYTNTNKYKVIKTLAGQEQDTTSGRTGLYSGLWSNTAAVTTLTFYGGSGDFVQYSHFAL